MFLSKDLQFNKVKEFHAAMDGETVERPQEYSAERAVHRADFKLEEIVEFLQATVDNDTDFEHLIEKMHENLDKAAKKAKQKKYPKNQLVGQVDALVDLLYLTYGSFVLMGVDPEPIFQIVHRANMGKIFPDGKAHYHPVTHKILKPADWEEKYAPESAILKEVESQIRSAELKE